MSSETDNLNEFAYLEREFTTEIFKLEIKNLGIFGISDIKKLLKSLDVDASKIKAPRHRDCVFVCLKSEEAVNQAIEKLNGYIWRGKPLSVKVNSFGYFLFLNKANMKNVL